MSSPQCLCSVLPRRGWSGASMCHYASRCGRSPQWEQPSRPSVQGKPGHLHTHKGQQQNTWTSSCDPQTNPLKYKQVNNYSWTMTVISTEFKSQHFWWYGGAISAYSMGSLYVWDGTMNAESFRATSAPLQMTSISGKALFLLSRTTQNHILQLQQHNFVREE